MLVSGKGTRFILADTEQLHVKISQMSDRIRQLEEALAKYHSGHELLSSELLSIRSGIELYGTQSSSSNPPQSPQEPKGNADDELSDMGHLDQLHAEGSERFPRTSPATPMSPSSPHASDTTAVPSDIMELSHNFPIYDEISSPADLSRRRRIREQLPPIGTANHYWEQARENALWQYNPHPNHIFWPNLLHHVYESELEFLCPRRLALLLMIMAVGCLVDLQRPSDPLEAERYHHLARASLCEFSVMEDTTVDAITCLFYMTWYLLVFSDQKKAAGYAWGLMGLTAKLAQSIGLHQDTMKAKVIHEELEKRRSLFWELMYLDARLALSLGRPPSLFIKHMDCKQPSYLNDGHDSRQYYQEWKHLCYVECLSPVLEINSSPSLDYSTVLQLDAKVREFSTPVPFRTDVIHSRAFIMQKASLTTALEAVLLQLHRTWFTRALNGTGEAFNRRHRYAPSVVAVFLSACRMIATVEELYRREPELSSRIYFLWSNAVSAAVALCVLVSRAPFTCLSPAALHELDRVRALFTDAKDRCPRALQVIPVLETMVEKAHTIYSRWADGQSSNFVLKQHEEGGNEPVKTKEDYAKAFMKPQPVKDVFDECHPSLAQCIHEVHQRALALFPLRKPCMCSAHKGPPDASWNEKPRSPLLPELYRGEVHGTPIYGLEGGHGAASVNAGAQASRIHVVDTLNFDFGVLNQTNGWMTWF